MKTKSIIEIVLITIIFGACTPATAIPVEEVMPSRIPSVITTLIPTHSPTPISTPATTLTPVPTYTPATPEFTYELQSWSANEADFLIAQIASNLAAIENEPIYQGVYGWSYYMEQYEYLAFSEKEALLRFPNAPQAEKWRWDLCYNLAFSFQYAESAETPELQCYAKLIEDGLNSGATTVTDLQSWFTSHEVRFDFSITSLNVPPGYESAYAITLEQDAVIWLLEQSGKYHATGLMSSMFFFRESGVKFQQTDLTGDNFPELILYFGRSHCCGSISTQFVYELSSGKPRLLSFKNLSGISTHVSSDYESFITPLATKSENPGLIFNSHYGYDPLTQPCNLREYDKYYWSGYQFELTETWFGIDEPGKYDDMEFCRFVIDTAKEQGELEIAVRTIGNIRVGDPDITRDQVLYRLGEYHARLGNPEKAREFFESTIALQQTDNKTTSKWIQDAQIFLDDLQDKDKFYETCSKILVCNIRDALQQLVTKISPNSFLSAPEILKGLGIPIKSYGYINFDGKNNIEQWLVIQHPKRSEREFWILVQGSEKVYGLFVANITSNKPMLEEFRGSNEYVITTSDGKSLISIESFGFTDQPYIVTHGLIESNTLGSDDDYLNYYLIEEPLERITNRLFSGIDPVLVQEELAKLIQSETFNCKKLNVCDKVYYLVGLTNELTGDNQAAMENYIRLWKEYPSSLYTIMIRSKLETP